MRFSPSKRTRIGLESRSGSSFESSTGCQYWRSISPVGVPGPTRHSSSLSSLVSMTPPQPSPAGREQVTLRGLVYLAAVLDVVDDEVVAEAVRVGEKDPAAVEPGQTLDEGRDDGLGVEHKRVDRDSVVRAARDLAGR